MKSTLRCAVLAVIALCSSITGAQQSPPINPPASASAAASSNNATAQPNIAKLAGQATGRVIYRGVTLISGALADAKQTSRPDMAIVVNGERIESIIAEAKLEAATMRDAEIVDARGLFAIAGLIDSHVHYATLPARAIAEAQLKRNIYGGLTGVRDMAGDARALADLSRAALINEIASPDIFYSSLVAGPNFFEDARTVAASLGMQPGKVPWLYAVTEESDLGYTIAQARGTGATGLKIYANLPGELVKSLVTAAKQQNLPVWTHLQVYPATPFDALGATSVSHVGMIARYIREPEKISYLRSKEPSYAGLTAADPGVVKYIDALAKSGTMMDATLVLYVPQKNPDGTPKPSTRCPISLAGDITRAMHAAGVPILAGTDADPGPDNPFPALHTELEALVQYAGMSPHEAIIAATRNAAKALGREGEIGTLEVGKFANMVLLKQDPVADIANVRSVFMTVKRGVRFLRSDYKHTSVPEPPG